MNRVGEGLFLKDVRPTFLLGIYIYMYADTYVFMCVSVYIMSSFREELKRNSCRLSEIVWIRDSIEVFFPGALPTTRLGEPQQDA